MTSICGWMGNADRVCNALTTIGVPMFEIKRTGMPLDFISYYRTMTGTESFSAERPIEACAL